MKPKSVKFNYYTLIKKMYKTSDEYDENPVQPFHDVMDVIGFITDLSKKKRFYSLKDDKFCFISAAQIHTVDNGISIQGNFISARNKFRPNLIDRQTGEERPNPKSLQEGDIERTHFAIKCDEAKNEVYLILQKNHQGVTPLNIQNYLKVFASKFLVKKKKKRDYTVETTTIARDDFFKALQNLQRARVAEVWVKKQILGSPALNFSNRIVDVKEDIKITIPSVSMASITSVAIDVFNSMSSKDTPISHIRIYGNDQYGNETILDTEFMGKNSTYDIDIHPDTGELDNTQIARILKADILKI